MSGITIESNQLATQKNQTSNASTVENLYRDPDSLIREYFLSSPSQRTKSRKKIAQYIFSSQSFLTPILNILTILKIGATGEFPESYDGAVAILAEIDNISDLWSIVVSLIELHRSLTENPFKKKLLDDCLEILIKAIACADKIEAAKRFNLIKELMAISRTRVLKATVIDSLGLMADEMELATLKSTIESFNSDKDEYIRNYAEEALQDLS